MLVALFGFCLLIVLVGSMSIYLLAFSPSAATNNTCSTGRELATLPTSNQNAGTLLNAFPVTCLKISDPQNGTKILDGLVYVAENSAEQAQGFQNVTSFGNCNGLASNGLSCVGMLFNFSTPQELCFWMHNTEIPLQQDWISANGTVVYVYQANPENDSPVCYMGKYVLETFPDADISLGNIVQFGRNGSI
jgi:uncharacterized membrane protein (UPF0127 family)